MHRKMLYSQTMAFYLRDRLVRLVLRLLHRLRLTPTRPRKTFLKAEPFRLLTMSSPVLIQQQIKQFYKTLNFKQVIIHVLIECVSLRNHGKCNSNIQIAFFNVVWNKKLNLVQPRIGNFEKS